MSDQRGDTGGENEDERRRRRDSALLLLRRVRDVVNRVCGRVEQIDSLLGDIEEIVNNIRELAHDTETYRLLPEDVRDRLGSLADQFEALTDGVGQLADVCQAAGDLLGETESVLDSNNRSLPDSRERSWLAKHLARLIAGLGAIAIVVVGVVLLLDDDDPPPNSGPRPPTSSLTPATIDLSPAGANFGTGRGLLTIELLNSGEESLEWQITEGPAWLVVDPSSGTTDASDSVSLGIDAAGFGGATGTLIGSLEIASNAGPASLQISVEVRQPDLIASLVVTAAAEFRDDHFAVPLRVTVTNDGEASASRFKVAVDYALDDRQFVVPFNAPPGSGEFYPFSTADLAGGDSIDFDGEVIFQFPDSVEGRTVDLIATADSCSGEEFTPEFCRVEESDETNNVSSADQSALQPLRIVVDSFTAPASVGCRIPISWSTSTEVAGRIELLRNGESIFQTGPGAGEFEDQFIGEGTYEFTYIIRTTSVFGFEDASETRRVQGECIN